MLFGESIELWLWSLLGNKNQLLKIKLEAEESALMGVWEDSQSFEYGLKLGTYKAKNYLQFMDTQADKATKRLFDTGKFTVIIQDNASIHR
ncbi:MAG TPA: hypothetical protein V6C71_09155, partial [Coleofasciculaceae cyanobacterium]